MKSTFALLATFVAAAVIAQDACQCKPLPTFSAQATDGKTYTQEMLSSKVAVIVFLKKGCPHNPKAALDFNRLAAAFKGKVPVVGVVDVDLATAKSYAKELKITFPLIADPKQSIVEGFGATNSLDLALVCSKDKKIGQVWKGYSQPILKELVAAVSHHGGPTLKVDLSKYPTKRASGCGF